MKEAEKKAGGHAMLSSQTLQTIDYWLAKFPPDKKRSALIQSLMAAQKQNGGWLNTELIEAVAPDQPAHEDQQHHVGQDSPEQSVHRVLPCSCG